MEWASERLARAAIAEMPAGTIVTRFDRLHELPFFSEDDEAAENWPDVVRDFRDVVSSADAVLLVTPEYNGAVPALLSNAIDIASRPHREGAIIGKPVAVIGASASPGAAQLAREQAVRSLRRAGAHPLDDHIGIGQGYQRPQLVDADTRARLRTLLDQLVNGASAQAA